MEKPTKNDKNLKLYFPFLQRKRILFYLIYFFPSFPPSSSPFYEKKIHYYLTLNLHKTYMDFDPNYMDLKTNNYPIQ